MKIIVKKIAPPVSLKDFCDEFNIDIVVEESNFPFRARFCATFVNMKVITKNNGAMMFPVGYGNTINEAIKSLAQSIQGRSVIINDVEETSVPNVLAVENYIDEHDSSGVMKKIYEIV